MVDAAPDTDASTSRGLASYGESKLAPRVTCRGVAGEHVAERDLRVSFVDGNDLLAIVNRSPTGVLASDWSPSDLVDIRTHKPVSSGECDKLHCLRKEAADALDELLAEMKTRGFPGKVESAFRSYAAQCGTFLRWAEKGSFCNATEQSALPGHSQHQLGTTVDLFTEEWAKDPRGVFREGFGCTPAGKFLQEHAWDFGFVMPYPIHPDDRHPKQSCVTRWDIPVPVNPKTGYRFEHWHARYIGKEAAQRFKKAFEASGPGTPNELTLEQWLRKVKGLTGPDAEIPVCDGCNCGECATLAADGESSCDEKKKSRRSPGGALHLDEKGHPVASSSAPKLGEVKRGRATKRTGDAAIVEVKVEIPEHVVTQPPIVAPDAARYTKGSTFEKLAPYPATSPRAFPPLEGAWVIGVEPVPNDSGVAWPWRAGLSLPSHAQTYDRANVLLPAPRGTMTLKVAVPEETSQVRVVLLEAGVPRGEPTTVDLR
ncbi:D-alanyl-D-alanine carboxypeptidase [Labilithrix luteola]|uniref:D-alanyl-D-alanine carboxypeptidase n=1 Tax=Labilithrix luteola TaxID=1391654 RepID=A0A0K1PRE1_9BACT|nr:D-alanyl-D-alanine carboxypeptidase [Labilithrix luteola]